MSMSPTKKATSTERRSRPNGEESASTFDPRLLALRVENLLPSGFAASKPMFGGITFLHCGNMLCCASRKGLMARVGAEAEGAPP